MYLIFSRFVEVKIINVLRFRCCRFEAIQSYGSLLLVLSQRGFALISTQISRTVTHWYICNPQAPHHWNAIVIPETYTSWCTDLHFDAMYARRLFWSETRSAILKRLSLITGFFYKSTRIILSHRPHDIAVFCHVLKYQDGSYSRRHCLCKTFLW